MFFILMAVPLRGGVKGRPLRKRFFNFEKKVPTAIKLDEGGGAKAIKKNLFAASLNKSKNAGGSVLIFLKCNLHAPNTVIFHTSE